MSAANTSSLLAPIALAPRDPILGITEAFNADPNPARINLDVGVYVGDDGRVPLLECVRRAESLLLEGNQPLSYLPIDGLQAYDKAASPGLRRRQPGDRRRSGRRGAGAGRDRR